MNLKFKIIVAIGALLLTASITSSIVNYRSDVNFAQLQLKNISLPLSKDNIYTEIQQRVVKPLIVSSLMASNTFVRDWVLDGEQDERRIRKYLKEIQVKYGMFTAFLVSDITKNYYHSKGVIDIINKNNNDDSWFFDFKKKKEIYEVNIDHDNDISDSLIMFINYKVKDYSGKFIAITGVGIKLTEIEKMLNDFKKKYNFDVYFVNTNGEIYLFAQALRKRGNISSIDGLKELKSSIFTKKSIQLEYESKGKEYVLSTKFIKELNLYLFVEVDKNSYMRDLNRKFVVNLLVSLFVTLLVILVIVYAINIYQKKLEKQAEEDFLTGLANRRKFNDEFEKMYNLYKRASIKTLSLVLIDIDNFKKINDTFGHLVGDKTLVRLSALLKKNLRKTDLVARWGGEEFSVLLVDTKKEEVEKIAQKLRLAVKEDKELLSLLEKPLTISLGCGELLSEDSQDGLIAKVDEALYKAKEQGKDQLVSI